MAITVDDIIDIRIANKVCNVKIINVNSYASLERWMEILTEQDYQLDTVVKSRIVMRSSSDKTDLCFLNSSMRQINLIRGLVNLGYSIPDIIKLSYLQKNF